jgi:hypothetical protein
MGQMMDVAVEQFVLGVVDVQFADNASSLG